MSQTIIRSGGAGPRCECPVVESGRTFEIRAVRFSGETAEVQDFLKSLPPGPRSKTVALLRYAAAEGLPSNREKCRKLTGDILEFKAHQVRLAFYRDRQVLFLLLGIVKKQDKWPTQDVKRAQRLRAQHEAEHG